jgi:S-layer protein (TIGR01567 family)
MHDTAHQSAAYTRRHLYDAIGFLGDKYFAAYAPTVTFYVTLAGASVAYLYDVSFNRNLMTNGQLSKILIDDASTKLLKKDQSLKLQEGYELVLKGVNSKGQLYLQLLKNGQDVDESFIAPPIYSSQAVGMADETYCYRKNLGDTQNIVQIAVHFQKVYDDETQPMALVDGIWQISDTPTTLYYDQQFSKLSIRIIDPSAMTITMDNKGNPINLTRKTDVEILPSIHLRTADNETLRFYIYKTEKIT